MHPPTYLELIRRGALQHGPRTAIVFGERSLSFTEVDQLSSRLAHALHAAGAAPRTRVALLLNNGLHSVPLDFACVKAGINRVPLNARLSLAEHARMLADRRSAYGQWDMPLAEALRREGAQGVPMVFAEGETGAARFAGGAGRHGEFGR